MFVLLTLSLLSLPPPAPSHLNDYAQNKTLEILASSDYHSHHCHTYNPSNKEDSLKLTVHAAKHCLRNILMIIMAITKPAGILPRRAKCLPCCITVSFCESTQTFARPPLLQHLPVCTQVLQLDDEVASLTGFSRKT